jgi:hypothetical protein
VAALVETLDGVDGILTREEAARKYHLVPERLGDLVVLGDRETMFGDMEHACRAFLRSRFVHRALLPSTFNFRVKSGASVRKAS